MSADVAGLSIRMRLLRSMREGLQSSRISRLWHGRRTPDALVTDASASIMLARTSSDIRELLGVGKTDDYTNFGPVRECLCGNTLFATLIWLDDDNSIGGYFTDGRCVNCGADLTIATEVDQPVM